MRDSFGLLTVEQWLAILRIGIGLWWLKSVFHKDLKKFTSGQMIDWTLSLADNHPWPWFGRYIRKLLTPTRAWFPYLILAGELSVAIGMIFGLLTPIALVVGIFLNLQYLLLAGAKPRDRSVNPAYQCEQGQNWAMIMAEVVLFFTFTATAGVWSLDSLLGIFVN
jgi:thiosulfate dehydrogenase [quinone] large subunit